MGGLLIAAGAVLWAGVLTSLMPCPLATNIAAVSYIGRQVGSPRLVLLSGLLYTLGRMISYTAVGMLIVVFLLADYAVSQVLQRWMNLILGPLLIVVGLFLLEMLSFSFSNARPGEQLQKKAASWGPWGAGLLGLIFALSFCPPSAALFFGSTIPLAVKHNSRILLPALYGLGTALPVIVFAFVLAFSANRLGAVYDKVRQIEFWARRITGVIFILAGIFVSLRYIFKVI